MTKEEERALADLLGIMILVVFLGGALLWILTDR